MRSLNNTLTKFNATFEKKIEMLTTIFIQDDASGAGVAKFTCTDCATLIKLYTSESSNGQKRWITSNFTKHLNNKHQKNENTIVKTSVNATPQITTFFKKNDINITADIPISLIESVDNEVSFADFMSDIAPELVGTISEKFSGEA